MPGSERFAQDAQGRLRSAEPVAIVDIGSNSVRLVVYENRSRSPAQVFNEKEMAGLGRAVTTTGRLADDAVATALNALSRFRILWEAMGVTDVHVIATAAARYASNGPEFLAAAEVACGRSIQLIPGEREAHLSALGVISGFDHPTGVVGDLGGGSLELVEVEGARVGHGGSVALGGLALQDRSNGSLKAAERIVKADLDKLPQIDVMHGRDFFAVGGTWRALGMLHQHQNKYPLNVMHNYIVPAKDASDFVRMVERADASTLDAIEAVSSARRPLLAYGALVLDQLIKRGRPRAVVISAQGVREGLLFEQLSMAEQAADPLIRSAQDYNVLRSRNPGHAGELIAWVDRFFSAAKINETLQDRRLRQATCLMSDIGWRAHPDYRGEQSLNVIAHAALLGVDHPGRAFIALAIFHRYAGLRETSPMAVQLRTLLTTQGAERMLILAAILRVAYLLSAAMPGILPQLKISCTDKKVRIEAPAALNALVSERVTGRLKQLAKLVGREADWRSV
jgi:exopolyphosphatase / guanosine-5'-triphosphate,3'-diphosphate pyrophosphatase